jgi:hypothetical protein
MSELILTEEAKQLCSGEGKAWSPRLRERACPGVTMLTVSPTRRNGAPTTSVVQFGERAMKFTVTSGAGVTASAGLFLRLPPSILVARSTFV